MSASSYEKWKKIAFTNIYILVVTSDDLHVD
jgi:hypothetical protein